MNAEEIKIELSLVSDLVSSQFPFWANLPLTPVPSAGTDNALFRLGEDMVIRLPRIHWATPQVEKEHKWLPILAPALPLPIPLPLAKGKPAADYPWHWSIYRWLAGTNEVNAALGSSEQAATVLAGFVAALHQFEGFRGPPHGTHNFGRGEPLINRDQQTRAAIAVLPPSFDPVELTIAWEAALNAPRWQGPLRWIHGDLQPGNVLIQNGRISAVIDFGCLGMGDPACDIMAAWMFFSADTRALFRAHLQVDEASWLRGRGWALSFGLTAYSHYQRTNPVLANIGRRAFEEVLLDSRGEN